MFIKISDKQHLLDELSEYYGSIIVFHYICSNCEDEQVTYEHEIDDELILDIDDNGVLIGLECTECGYNEVIVDTDSIIGFEII